MSFRFDPREVVDVYLRLKKAGVDPFSLESEAEMARVAAIMATDPGTSTVPLFDALRAIDMYVKENLARLSPVSVVATQPGRGRVPSTREIVRSLLSGTKKELLVVGYAVTDRRFVELLHATARRGITVILVGDRVQASLQETLARWPPELVRPVALEGVEPIPDGRFSVHGKVLVSDGHRALFGSADFSAAGFRDNFELGVLVEGHAARELRDTVEELRRQGWLVPVSEHPVTQAPEVFQPGANHLGQRVPREPREPRHTLDEEPARPWTCMRSVHSGSRTSSSASRELRWTRSWVFPKRPSR